MVKADDKKDSMRGSTVRPSELPTDSQVRPSPKKWRKWSDEEIEKLRRIYPNTTLNAIRESLPNRTLCAIHGMANKLKIKREVNEGRFEKGQIVKRAVLFKKGQHPSPETEFKKGHKPWNEGIPWADEERKKMSETKRKRYVSGEIQPWNKGKKGSQTAWNKGKTYEELFGKEKSLKLKKKLSVSHVGLQVGESHPNWKGGHEGYYGEDWYGQRLKARKRDKGICYMCGANEKDCKRKFHIHHVVPYRIGQDNSLDNLITLCGKCHPRIDNITEDS